MTKKLVWPATFLAAFALAAACGGGSTDADGMGGEGGQDGSGGGDTVGSGGSTGGQSVGGEGGLGGNGPVVVVPLTCSDGEQNESETDVDCGGPDCDPCDDDASCVEPTDCESGLCTEGVCSAPECGDGIVNGTEDCDPGRETNDCDADCTFAKCGDGYVNERVEECEPDPDLGPWQRCGNTCMIGSGLDGTWRGDDRPGTDSPWELLQLGVGFYGYYRGMQSFHYTSTKYLYDLTGNQRYDIKNDIWSPLPNALPYSIVSWENAAVDSRGLWVPRASAMHRLDLETLEWTTPTDDLPDASGINGSGAVYDSDGFIWYVGASDGEQFLVKYDPGEGTFETFSWLDVAPGYVAYEARVGYDPITDQVAFISYGLGTFLLFDLDTESFSESAPLPNGDVASDNCCQDRAGGMYVTTQGTSLMYRYDIGANEYVLLPDLPGQDDYGSTCVVSELGYLYYGTSVGPVFARLRLNRR